MKSGISNRAAGARIVALCALIAGLSVPCMDAVADQANPLIEIDHATGKVKYKRGSIEIMLDTAAPRTVPLRPGESLKINILDTNTLLYTYGQEVKEEDFVDKTALFKYLGGLQGGITALLGMMVPQEMSIQEATRTPFEAPPPLIAALKRLRNALAEVAEDARRGARLESVYYEALQTSEAGFHPKAGDGYPPGAEAIKGLLRSEGLWSDSSSSCCQSRAEQLVAAARTNAWENGLALEVARLDAVKERNAFAAKTEAKSEAGEKLLGETDKVLEAIPSNALDLSRQFAKLAVQFARLHAWLTASATQHKKEPEAIPYRWDKSQTVTIAVEKRKDLADKIAYRDRKFEKVTFVVSPEWFIQPSIGAGLIWADKLVWPEWTVLDANGAKTVASNGMADERFQFFPLLSLTSPALSCLASWHAEATGDSCNGWRRGKAVALDLGWNASTSEPAYLLGGSIVLSRQFKIGGGVVWQRRQVLDGIEPGDTVPASGIPLRQSYPPAPYLMFSILGWPPFTSGQ